MNDVTKTIVNHDGWWWRAGLLTCGGLSAVLGAVVLLGWYTHQVTLIQVHPSFVPMQYNTALCFLLCGIGVVTLHRIPRLATVCGVVAASVGALTLAEYLFGMNLGLDQLFMKHYITVATPHAGRMAPTTAVCFVLTGSAILASSRTAGRAVRSIGLLGLLTFVLGAVAIMGYVSSVESSYGWGNLSHMAVHTASGFVVLGIGLLAVSLRHGLQVNAASTMTTLFAACVAMMLWHVSILQSAIVENTALGSAAAQSKALAEFRTLYTSEVVVTAKEHGLEVSHDYATKEGAIPLPATLSMMLGARLGEQETSAPSKLYSAYPFPWRKDSGGLANDFAQEAWAALNKNPDEPFYRFGQTPDGFVLRYATADRMRSSCVNCHNSHPDSPKRDWKIGDVRGVLEVAIPLNSTIAQTESGMRGTLALVAMMSLIGLSGLIASIRKFRRNAAQLEHQVSVRTRDLEIAKEAADTANTAKTEFLANMSHEIRTPMTAILGFADVILEQGDLENAPPQRAEAAKTIKRNGEYLLGLINDILDLSKIEADKMTIERADCQPCRIVAEVASLMRVRADAKGLPFKSLYIGAIPETIQSDPTRLRQILINLIGNAIKFTEVGDIRLVTRLVDDGAIPSLQFDVIDTGCGMTEQQVAKLFQPFTQADTSTTRKFGGTGLGLTISRRFADLLGGDITVPTTELGVGTTFRVSVTTGPLDGVKMLENPNSETVVNRIESDSTHVAPSTLHGVRILFAEDGPDNQRLISFILSKVGADVTVEENGLLALDTALKAREAGTPFDCILMDMQMPVMDGYESTKRLRRAGYTGPIIALTAHAMAGDRTKCLDVGCDDYETKPIDRVKLVETVARHVQKAAEVA